MFSLYDKADPTLLEVTFDMLKYSHAEFAPQILRQKRRKRNPVPEEEKDEIYWEKVLFK